MKTNITLATILLILLSACTSNPPAQPTIDVPAIQTLAYETAIAGVTGTATANAPTATLQPTATNIPTPTTIPTYTPLPELLPNAIDLQWITAYGLPGDQFATKLHPTQDGGFILVGNTVVDDLSSALLFKLRADGLIVWQKSLPQVSALDVLETSAGDFVLAGDLHWIKFDSQGDLLWQYPFEQPSYHSRPILRLVEESNGNIVVEAIGSRTVFSAEAELQSFTEYVMHWDSQTYPGNVRDRSGETLWAGEAGEHQYWVGKADLNGGWLKVFSFPETPIGPTLFIQTTADGGAIVGHPIYGEGGFNLLFSRFSRDGSVRWQKVYWASFSDFQAFFHAFETQSGDFIVAGTLDYYYDLNPPDSRNDVWMWRLDRDGNTRWLKVYGTEGLYPEGQDAVAVIQELSNGDLIFAGQTNGTGTGGQDMWVLKTNAQGEIPNCGLALDIPESWGRAGGVSPEGETIALAGVSLIEREKSPIVKDEQRLYYASAQTIPLCSPSP